MSLISKTIHEGLRVLGDIYTSGDLEVVGNTLSATLEVTGLSTLAAVTATSIDASGNVVLSAGNLTLNTGDVIVTLGDVIVSAGDLQLAGNITQIGSAVVMTIDPVNYLELGRNTNDLDFVVDIMYGDGSANVNHRFRGSGYGGHAWVCGDMGSFGVGTKTPATTLDVDGQALLRDTVTAQNGINLTGPLQMFDDILQVGTASSFDIDPHQEVHIGKNTNDADFAVSIYKGDGTTTVNHLFEGVGDSYICGDNGSLSVGHTGAPRGAIDIYDTGGIGFAYMPGDGGWIVKRNQTGSATGLLIRNGNDDDILFVTCDGKVGINDSTPSFALDVIGDIRTNGGVYYTNSIEIRQDGGSGTYAATPLATSNKITIDLVTSSDAAPTILNVEMDNFHDGSMMPIFIGLTFINNDSGSASMTVNFRNAANDTIVSVSSSVSPTSDEQWGLILTYVDVRWYVLSEPIETILT